jgi:hypothetical protein
MQRFGCSQRNALRVVKMSISTYLYRSVARDTTALKLRIKEITTSALPESPPPPHPAIPVATEATATHLRTFVKMSMETPRIVVPRYRAGSAREAGNRADGLSDEICSRRLALLLRQVPLVGTDRGRKASSQIAPQHREFRGSHQGA